MSLDVDPILILLKDLVRKKKRKSLSGLDKKIIAKLQKLVE